MDAVRHGWMYKRTEGWSDKQEGTQEQSEEGIKGRIDLCMGKTMDTQTQKILAHGQTSAGDANVCTHRKEIAPEYVEGQRADGRVSR